MFKKYRLKKLKLEESKLTTRLENQQIKYNSALYVTTSFLDNMLKTVNQLHSVKYKIKLISKGVNNV